jgi:tryptophanyl-tRNA synthetase
LSPAAAAAAAATVATVATAAATTTTTTHTTHGTYGTYGKKTILSGIQPTGSLHLGNYLGSLSQWLPYQKSHNCLFCIVDLHAITSGNQRSTLYNSTLDTAALYIAAGLDPNACTIFVQSHVASHAEVSWLLQCMTPLSWLKRMIQFKEKSSKNEDTSVGLLCYPLLMASDIMIYNTDLVPVGEDQRQHLELTRDVVNRFNDQYCKGNAYKRLCKKMGYGNAHPVFKVPEAVIVDDGSGRVMSLSDGTNKMSKSDPNDNSRINLTDSPDVIRKKVGRCKTDDRRGIDWDVERPEASNLLNIYQAVSSKKREEIREEVKDMRWDEFKPVLAEAIVKCLEPIQERYKVVREDEEGLKEILRKGAEVADGRAKIVADKARAAMGFVEK